MERFRPRGDGARQRLYVAWGHEETVLRGHQSLRPPERVATTRLAARHRLDDDDSERLIAARDDQERQRPMMSANPCGGIRPVNSRTLADPSCSASGARSRILYPRPGHDHSNCRRVISQVIAKARTARSPPLLRSPLLLTNRISGGDSAGTGRPGEKGLRVIHVRDDCDRPGDLQCVVDVVLEATADGDDTVGRRG